MSDEIYYHDHGDGVVHAHHLDGSHIEGHSHTHSHTQTKAVLNRMARLIGHLQSVRRMVEEGRDCSEVLLQISAVDAALMLGLPEARIPLANAAVMLATAPKSNSAYKAFDAAAAEIHAGKGTEIPLHLRSPKFRGYKYPHDYPGHWVRQQYLPDELVGTVYYRPGDNKFEQSCKTYWDRIKGE